MYRHILSVWKLVHSICPLLPSSGDPHIRSWTGQYFDYMGECDLVMAKTDDIDIHVRTTIRYDYSYVEAAAIKIGEDILEVGSFGQHFFNGVEGALVNSRGMSVGGHPVYHRQQGKKRHFYDIVMDGKNVTLATYKDIVSVNIQEGLMNRFDGVGLLGNLHGKLLARDGKTDLSADPNALGQEWQVTSDEPMLFSTIRAPQYPAKCVLPSASQKEARRLAESDVSKTAAEMACARFTGSSFEACVYDVMAFGDLEYAQAGTF